MRALRQHEYEAKFQVTPTQHPALFAQPIALNGYTQQPQATLLLRDSYFDSATYTLLRQGIVLRVRRKGDRHEAGIKSINGEQRGVIQRRIDLAAPLPADIDPNDATTWSGPILDILAPYGVKLNELRLLFVLQQRRQKALVGVAESGTAIAEWSLDEVGIVAQEDVGDRADGEPPLAASFHELEIELLPPSAEGDATVDQAFAMLVSDVQKHFKLKPSFTSKFVRGLESTIAHAHGNQRAIISTQTLEEAGRLLLHQQLLQIMLNEHGIRNTNRAKYVHDMRVAIRRARAAIRFTEGAFDPDTLDQQVRCLRRLGRSLGAVRDLDVTMANLRAFARTQPAAARSGLRLLRDELKKRRDLAKRDLLSLLDSKKHRRFVTGLVEFCTTPSKRDGRAQISDYEVIPVQVRHTAPSMITAAFEAVRAYETRILGSEVPPLETFHALRIRAKYLRYLLEFTQHLLGEEAEALVEQLRDLQENLGYLNDAHVERERLRAWLVDLPPQTPLREAMETRLTEIETRLDELVHSTPTPFAALISQPTRVRLATALAHL
jgi:CHAD domain-containing protein